MIWIIQIEDAFGYFISLLLVGLIVNRQSKSSENNEIIRSFGDFKFFAACNGIFFTLRFCFLKF